MEYFLSFRLSFQYMEERNLDYFLSFLSYVLCSTYEHPLPAERTYFLSLFCLFNRKQMFHSLEFQFQKTGEKFHDYFFRRFAVVKKVTEGLFWGQSMVI